MYLVAELDVFEPKQHISATTEKENVHQEKVIFPQCCKNSVNAGPPPCYSFPVTLNNYNFTFSCPYTEFEFDQCRENKTINVNEADITEFTPKGSVLLKLGTELHRISFNINCINYCDEGNNIIIYYSCNEVKESTVYEVFTRVLYISCLILSTLCYVCAVLIHTVVLNVQDTHKKIFVGYCLSMGATFLCLILFQFINTNCNYLGSFFFVFILASFVWISSLCLDIVYLIRNFTEKENKERLIAYIAGAVAIPLALLLISVLPRGIAHVPKLFVDDEELCKFHKGEENGDYTEPLFLFIPIGLLIMASAGFLSYCWYLIRNNDIILENDIMWLEKSHSFKYVTKSYWLLLLISSIWTFGAFLQYENLVNITVFKFIEGLQGIFVLAIFVFNRYTRKQIGEVIFEKKETERKSSRFNKDNIIKRFKRNDTTVDDKNYENFK